MKRRFILILLTLITCSLFAQSVTTLEGVCASLAAHSNTTGDFTQTKTIQTNGRKLKSTGKYIICPEGIVWKTERPVPSSLILTKDKMIQVAANGKKSVMDGNDNQIFSNISEILSSVFSGNAASIRKNFNCDFQMKNDGEWSVSLEPKDSTIASVMNTLVLSGTCTNSNDAEMKSLVISETSGNTISYEFTNQKYPEELSADEKQNFIVE